MWVVIGLLGLAIAICGLIVVSTGMFGDAKLFKPRESGGLKAEVVSDQFKNPDALADTSENGEAAATITTAPVKKLPTRAGMMVGGSIVLGVGGCLVAYSWSGEETGGQTNAARIESTPASQPSINNVELSTVYGNWARKGDGNAACTQKIETFLPNTYREFIWTPEFGNRPATRVNLEVTYLVRGTDILMSYKGGDGYEFFSGYRLTTNNTMHDLDIRKRDGAIYDPRYDKRIPDVATVSTALSEDNKYEYGKFVRCGQEADSALARH
jgi:hypothetical protein